MLAPPLDHHAKIWRYISISKYLNLLQSKSLYFTRSDRFDDPFEGSSTECTIQDREEFFRSAGFECKPSSDIDAFFNKLRSCTFINCWHMNEHESEAMWRLYGHADELVSIQSTYNALSNALGSANITGIGIVRYIDYSRDRTGPLNTLTNFLHKRKSFEHEKEIRAIIQILTDKNGDLSDPDAQPEGIAVPVVLEELISCVYVSPLSPSWFQAVVQRATENCGYSFSVNRSVLANTPVY